MSHGCSCVPWLSHASAHASHCSSHFSSATLPVPTPSQAGQCCTATNTYCYVRCTNTWVDEMKFQHCVARCGSGQLGWFWPKSLLLCGVTLPAVPLGSCLGPTITWPPILSDWRRFTASVQASGELPVPALLSQLVWWQQSTIAYSVAAPASTRLAVHELEVDMNAPVSGWQHTRARWSYACHNTEQIHAYV